MSLPAPDTTLAARLLETCRAAGLTLATAESCTGGLVSACLTAVPGSSAVVMGGVASYANSAKTDLLGVLPATLAAHGAVSEPVAAEMAKGARQRLGADLAVSITGVAGPGGSEAKPEGMVCFAIASARRVITRTEQFGPCGRDEVRRKSAELALTLLLEAASGAAA
ncbi:CinA family protein [Pseudooceanicola algae]|uniref:Nicotinamide-nucleotide amidohydrolase PncC n=1 Tax=Pseudooceanicola algae TaxID=1537215 RepID=A0A418SEI3_9RHOB|nr:nicotinamide-nucleotide amidohydrolase family protein [Pseudooceanicola algae]QPM89774.1 Nicotinamide-nucleotide amidohydrolase PncC [Pseudooceanicola algae]